MTHPSQRFRRHLLQRLARATGLASAVFIAGCDDGTECFEWSSASCPSRLEASDHFELDCGEYVESVDSEAFEDAGECCYEVTVAEYKHACCNDTIFDEPCVMEGRPLRVEGAAVRARSQERADWRSGAHPHLEELGDAERRALALSWTRSALDEHASIASFARFGLELMAHGAPAELIAAAHQAALDEVRHAGLGFALASAYAGEPVGPSALPLPAALTIEHDLAAFALATAVDACINETLAVLVAAEARSQATDAAVCAALDEIVHDESNHAELAWRTLRWALERGGAPVRRALVAALGSYDPLDQAPEEDALAVPSHGLLDARTRRLALGRGWREVVRPCLTALLEAPSAIDAQSSLS